MMRTLVILSVSPPAIVVLSPLIRVCDVCGSYPIPLPGYAETHEVVKRRGGLY